MVKIAAREEAVQGECLVTVPPAIRAHALSNPLLSGLLVTDAGYFPAAASPRMECPQGSWTHLLISCSQGEGWVKVAERRIAISAGEVVWIPADTAYAYGSAQDDPWSIVWAHFCGPNAARWLAEIHWADSTTHTFRLGPRGASTFGLEAVYSSLERGYSFHHLLTARIALEQSLSNLLEQTSLSNAEKSAEERTANVRKLIAASPRRKYRLPELAGAAGVSVPHFINLFKKQCGFAPIDYVLRERIRMGCELLDTTTATIAAIAEKVGFKDPYYFSRCFTRIMGSSPRQYRNAGKA